jgi:hypothetical protein
MKEIIIIGSILAIVIFGFFLPSFIPTGNVIIKTECLEQGWNCLDDNFQEKPCEYLLRCYDFYFDKMLIGRSFKGMTFINETWVNEQPKDGTLFIGEREVDKNGNR